jgi:RHS repeat-associated protein
LASATDYTASPNGWSQSYGFDRFGNRWVSANGTLPMDPRTPDSSSDINATNSRLTGSNYGYDLAGNQTTYGGWALTYDAENRLKSSQPSAGTLTTYAYDGDGRRVKKTTGATSTWFIYDASGQLAAEYGGTAPPETGTHYLTTDHLGSTRLVLNASGAVESRHDYLPFGEEIPGSVGGRSAAGYKIPSFLRQKFTGKERDEAANEAGLDYFLARYYASPQGRFLTPDAPFADQSTGDPQSWNLYTYVRNNPQRFSDPTGRACLDGSSWASCGEYLLGAVKAVANLPWDAINLPNRALSPAVEYFTGESIPDLLPAPFQPTNVDQERGMQAAQIMLIVLPVAELSATKITEATGMGSRMVGGSTPPANVPTSIPAGPTARPTASQQRAINEMGNAHGCSTCGSSNPGTTTGNWVGDHQPPTALNPPSGPQVYRPQCLGCSRQQGGRVAAEARAARKAAEEAAKKERRE